MMHAADFDQPLPFYKMHGLGNDFVVIDARRADDPVSPSLVAAVGDRHRGVGFDQLAVIAAPESEGTAARIHFWNPDGGKAGACGNATRCVADLLMQEYGVAQLALETDRGALTCERVEGDHIRVNMGRPKLDWREIPLAEASFTEKIDVKLGPIDKPAMWGPGAVNMGNPHCVFFVDDAEMAPVEKLGPFIESHPMFPERTNVAFVEVLSPHALRARIWERGTGVTLACGSGACAVVVAGARRALCARHAQVNLDGGPLHVTWSADDDCVYLTGPTQMVFAGALSPDFLNQIR
jgi:diaminopimelate epimerase